MPQLQKGAAYCRTPLLFGGQSPLLSVLTTETGGMLVLGAKTLAAMSPQQQKQPPNPEHELLLKIFSGLIY